MEAGLRATAPWPGKVKIRSDKVANLRTSQRGVTCIKVLSHIGQNFATIPTQNMHFVKGNNRFKL